MFKFCIYSSNNNANLVGTILSKRGNWEQIDRTEDNKAEIFTQCNFIWKPTNLSTAGYNKLDQASRSRPKDSIQVFNHFENLYGLCTKTGLVRSLRKYYTSTKESKQIKYNVYDTTPTSFLVSPNLSEYEYSLFAGRFQEIAKQDFSRESLPQKHCTKNFWLVKPADQNQGRGIQVFNKLHEIEEFLTSKTNQSFWVIQKYLERPLLYKGRKFDIRMWAFVTAKNEIFLFRKGYLRTSSEEFDLKNSNNYVHLTNNCLQKHNNNYGQHEEGNTLPLEILDSYFAEAYPELKPTVESHIMPRIRDLVIDTILATKRDLNPLNRKNAFEFLGYDFMIDEDLRTWLIEANTNPYIGVPTEYIGGLLNVMLDDLLKIVVDPLLPPQETADPSRPNGFELLYCENGSAHHNGPMNLRTPFKKNVYPAQELVPQDITKKLLILERGPEPVQNQAKFKESKSLKALKPRDNKEKSKDVVRNNREKVENQGEDKDDEREVLKPRKQQTQQLEQNKETNKQPESNLLNKERTREKNPRRNRSPKLERVSSEDISLKRENSHANQSKEIHTSRDKSRPKGISIREDTKENGGDTDRGEVKEQKGEQLPFINEVMGAMKDQFDKNNNEKFKPKGKLPKALRLPYKGLGTLYGQNPRKNQTDQQPKIGTQETPHDYMLDVELFNPAQLEIEGFVIKTLRENDNQVPVVQQVTEKANKVEEPARKLDVEELHRDLHLALVYKTNHNSESFTKKVSSVLECLSECEIFTEKQSQTACRILTFIAQSDARGLLTQQFAVEALMKVLRSPNTKQSMKCHIVDIFYMLAKIPGLKARLLSTSFVSDIVKLYLSEQSDIAQNEQFLLLTVYCLLTIGKVFNRRAFTTDAFIELQPARYAFICQGGVLAIWFLIRKLNDPELRSFTYKSFFDHIPLEDLEQQFFLMRNINQDHIMKPHVEPFKKSITLSSIPMDREKPSDEEKISKIVSIHQPPQNQGEKSQRNVNTKEEIPAEEAEKETFDLKKEAEKASGLFKAFAEVFNKEHLVKEFEEYIDIRRDGQFGFDDEDRERRKYMIENAKGEEGNILQVGETEEASHRNKKAIIDRLEKKVENTLQKYQLEVNCRQKEIKELLKEKEIEDKKRHARSLLQQRAEAMRRRNKLDLKKKEMQKLAFKVIKDDDKSDQPKPQENGPFEINVQKATWAALRSYGSQKDKDGEEPSPLKIQMSGVTGDVSSKIKAKQSSLVFENVPSALKSSEKPSQIQTENNSWALETSRAKQFGGMLLAIDSRRGSTNPIEESPFSKSSPWKSAKGALNEFLQGPTKASLSPKSRKPKPNLTETHTISKNCPTDAVNSDVVDFVNEGAVLPGNTHRASQLLKESPKLPPVTSKRMLNAQTLYSDEKVKPGGLKSFSMLFDNKLQTSTKGKFPLGKEANKFF